MRITAKKTSVLSPPHNHKLAPRGPHASSPRRKQEGSERSIVSESRATSERESSERDAERLCVSTPMLFCSARGVFGKQAAPARAPSFDSSPCRRGALSVLPQAGEEPSHPSRATRADLQVAAGVAAAPEVVVDVHHLEPAPQAARVRSQEDGAGLHTESGEQGRAPYTYSLAGQRRGCAGVGDWAARDGRRGPTPTTKPKAAAPPTFTPVTAGPVRAVAPALTSPSRLAAAAA